MSNRRQKEPWIYKDVSIVIGFQKSLGSFHISILQKYISEIINYYYCYYFFFIGELQINGLFNLMKRISLCATWSEIKQWDKSSTNSFLNYVLKDKRITRLLLLSIRTLANLFLLIIVTWLRHWKFLKEHFSNNKPLPFYLLCMSIKSFDYSRAFPYCYIEHKPYNVQLFMHEQVHAKIVKFLVYRNILIRR